MCPSVFTSAQEHEASELLRHDQMSLHIVHITIHILHILPPSYALPCLFAGGHIRIPCD
jgi:hypothetical protein